MTESNPFESPKVTSDPAVAPRPSRLRVLYGVSAAFLAAFIRIGAMRIDQGEEVIFAAWCGLASVMIYMALRTGGVLNLLLGISAAAYLCWLCSVLFVLRQH